MKLKFNEIDVTDFIAPNGFIPKFDPAIDSIETLDKATHAVILNKKTPFRAVFRTLDIREWRLLQSAIADYIIQVDFESEILQFTKTMLVKPFELPFVGKESDRNEWWGGFSLDLEDLYGDAEVLE